MAPSGSLYSRLRLAESSCASTARLSAALVCRSSAAGAGGAGWRNTTTRVTSAIRGDRGETDEKAGPGRRRLRGDRRCGRDPGTGGRLRARPTGLPDRGRTGGPGSGERTVANWAQRWGRRRWRGSRRGEVSPKGGCRSFARALKNASGLRPWPRWPRLPPWNHRTPCGTGPGRRASDPRRDSEVRVPWPARAR